MKKDKHEKCRSCVNLDIEKTNEKWIVCSEMPIEVMAAGSSADCKKYSKETK